MIFISGGSGSEWAIMNNLNSFKQYQIIPRILQKSETLIRQQFYWANFSIHLSLLRHAHFIN